MPKSKPPLTASKMHDPSFCHYCNVNKLDPKDKYYLPCAGTARRITALARQSGRQDSSLPKTGDERKNG